MTRRDSTSGRDEPVGKPDAFTLTHDHRMLLDIRDTLYEGDWSAFTRDLLARADGKPHVFQTVPATSDMIETIREHLALIAQMSAWESASGRKLSGKSAPA